MPLSQNNLPKRVWPKGQKWNDFNVPVGVEYSLDEVMSAEFWQHCHHQINVGDTIRVWREDNGFDAEIRLLMKRQGEMKFSLVWQRQDVTAAAPVVRSEKDQFEVKHSGFGKWKVVEKSTGTVIADGFDKAGAEEERLRLESTRKAA